LELTETTREPEAAASADRSPEVRAK
jgi:hypothetical protein